MRKLRYKVVNAKQIIKSAPPPTWDIGLLQKSGSGGLPESSGLRPQSTDPHRSNLYTPPKKSDFPLIFFF